MRGFNDRVVYGMLIVSLISTLGGAIFPESTARYRLMRNLAAEYVAKGITVNTVSPDMIETNFLSDIPDLIRDQSAKNNPLGKNMLVNEAVPTIEYLLSPESDAVTRQNIGVPARKK